MFQWLSTIWQSFSKFIKQRVGKISYSSWTYKALTFVFSIFSNIRWERLQAVINGGIYYRLKEEDHDKIRALLEPGYYFILTRRRCHLTTYLIAIASFIATGKVAHYAHVLMNVDDGNIKNDNDFKLIEATAKGVHYSTFMQVFDCDSVAILRPKNMNVDEWTQTLDHAIGEIGKEYDNLFDILDDTKVSCVEMCRQALQAEPNYVQDFSQFEKMIKANGNQLTPQMLYDCPDFEIVFEVRR